MQHNPHEIGQLWRPPGGLYHARQCASSFFCPPLRSTPQTLVNFLQMPLHFQTLCWPRPRPPAPTRRDIGYAVDALACGWVDCRGAFRPARPAKFWHLNLCAPAAQAVALNYRFGVAWEAQQACVR
eukprot:357272-Chlamydomonas_euryale.AAC.1